MPDNGGAPDHERSSRLDELYRSSASAALRLAYVLTGDRDIANDLVQEAFVRMIGRFGHIRQRDSLEAYLRRTVINLAKSRWRRASVERRHLASASPVASIEPPDIESRHDLWGAVLQLPVRQRIAVVLRYYEDLSEHQAAEVMGLSPRAVNSLVSRGLAQLRRLQGNE